MLAKLFLLALVAASQARPRDGKSDHDLCPAVGHHLLPHEWDCTLFYYCEYGLKWELPRQCAPGTHFSYELQVCVMPEIANCTLPGVPPTEAAELETEATEAPETEPPVTGVPISVISTTSKPETDATTTDAPTGIPIGAVSTTATPQTEEPTTEPPVTGVPISVISTTAKPETEATTTEEPTPEATTAVPIDVISTNRPQTEEPTTEEPTTDAQTTVPIGVVSTTATPQTEEPTTEPPATGVPISVISTTAKPETEAPEDNEIELLPNGCPADFEVHLLLPHESDCAKFYYCNFGEKVERPCAPGTYFNPELQVCDWPENVNCANSNGSNEDGNDSEDNGDGDNETDNGNDNESEWLENGCPADFGVHHLLPHETDCAKFYYCNFGEKVERPCGPGTYFNPELQVCDWPENVKCASGNGDGDEDKNESGNGDGNGTEEGDGDDSGNSKENEDGDDETENGNDNESEWLENGCPADFGVHHLLPHESDCAKFYHCVHGVKVVSECGPGTLFNPEIQVCDWPQNVNCAAGNGESNETGGNGTEEEDGNDGNDNGNDSSESDNGEGNGTTENGDGDGNESEWLDNGCPADFGVHHLLPHESDCAKFYYCVHGVKIESECGPGTLFNPEIQVCDWPQNVNCAAGNGESNETGGNGTEEEDGNDGNDNGNDSSESDNGEGNETDNGDGDDDDNESEWLENGCPADFGVHQLLPHESDCAKFYYCVHGQKVESKCGPGTLFNPEIQVCDWPQNVNCAAGNGDDNENSNETDGNGTGEENGNDGNNDGNGSDETDNGNENEDNEDGDDNEESGSGDANNSNENGNGEGNNNSNETDNGDGNDGDSDNGDGDDNESEWLENGCPADFGVHHLLPHESDCAKFYYCVHGVKVESECGPGTLFNPEIQVCDWPQNVNCAAGNGESNETGGNGTEEEDGNDENDNGNDSSESDNGEGNGTESGDGDGNESEWLDNGCPADFGVHHLLPHESDCAKFYYCVHGVKVESECGPGTLFNSEIQVCDWPQNVNCTAGNGESNETGGNGTEEEDGNDGNNDNDSSESDNGEGNETDNGDGDDNESEWLENGCPNDFGVHHLLPHESDCAKFYSCVHGVKVESECGPGTLFNPEIQVCDWPQNVNCAADNGDSSENSNETDSNGTGEEDGNDGDNGDNGSDEADSNGTGEEDGNDGNNGGNGSDETDGNGTGEEDGNDGNNGVNGSDETDNGNDNGDNEDGDDNEESGSGDANNSNENVDGVDAGETEEDNVDHSKCAESCNVAPWAHETACDKYWRCDGEKAILVICAEGLHFNARTGTCDFICNANCLRQHVQTTSDNSGLKIFVPWDKVDESMRIIYDLH